MAGLDPYELARVMRRATDFISMSSTDQALTQRHLTSLLKEEAITTLVGILGNGAPGLLVAEIGERLSGADRRSCLTELDFAATGIRIRMAPMFRQILYPMPWGAVRSFALEDRSRVTATRVATFGAVGLGMQKATTLLVMGMHEPPDLALEIAKLTPAQVQARLERVAAQVPYMAELLRGRDPLEQPPPPAAAPLPGPPDAGARLRQLIGLHSEGIISDEEFAEKRAQLLEEL